MGIVAFCPSGHRIKVKDHLAGRKGICPTCGSRFRIPWAAAATVPAGSFPPAAGMPLAAVVSLDGELAATVCPVTWPAPCIRQLVTGRERPLLV